MNLFDSVKDRISTRAAAEMYGLQVDRKGFCKCPFHDDKNPSMKTDRRFHCFGCNADGDVIDFAARLFSLSPKDAAMKLADDFTIAELLAFVTNDDDESEQVRHEYKTILEAMLSVRKLFTVNE